MATHARAGFRAGGAALIRATGDPQLTLPPLPDLAEPAPDHVAIWVDWLRQVWAVGAAAEAITLASPVLARQVRALCETRQPATRDARRAALSVTRYLRRMQGRATPFGLFAGVAALSFEAQASARWGVAHRAVTRAGGEWLAQVVAVLESCPELLPRLTVVANSTLAVRGDRLIVPYQPQRREGGTGAVEVSLRYGAPVRAAVEAAHTPIRLEDLEAKVRAEFPAAAPEKVSVMLAGLVTRRALITCLHAPGTEPDALGYLLAQLEEADAGAVAEVAGLAGVLRQIHTELQGCGALPVAEARPARERVAARMQQVAVVRRHPFAVDLRLDATVTLPWEVAREVEGAAAVLARISAHPYGSTAWKAYHQRFYERFGIGSMVPLLDVVADSGIGWPDGYPGTPSERRLPVSGRDETLLALAQASGLEGCGEVMLDEPLIAALELEPDQPRLPPHLEVGVRVHAADLARLQASDFQLEVVSVSRGAGVGIGRFLSVLEPQDRARLSADLANLPGSDGDTVTAQMSFPPLVPETAHVARTVQVLPTVISLGEYRAPGRGVLAAEDLAVGCDGRRMYLAAPVLGQRVEAVGMHALNLHTHTPPLARFLIELSRAQCAQATVFDWGAARSLPFLPRVRHGRTILSPARWRLEASELPAQMEPSLMWDRALEDWRARRRLPRLVHLAEGDRLMPLDLDQAGHRALLRSHLDTATHAVLNEAPAPVGAGWCGGRAHEVVVPLAATKPPPWPRLPRPTRARIIGRNQGQTPATSRVLLASLYGDIRRQDTILTGHLHDLLDRLHQPPWWYVRFRDPDQHLRLRIALPEPEAFGKAAHTVSTWADELHHLGLLREVRYPISYLEVGRWGSGAAWHATEEVFRADSRALLTQLRQLQRPSRRALVAAHTVAISAAFTGSTGAGMRWLIDHVPATAPTPIPRSVFTEAVRLADPRDDWAALRAEPGGAAIADAWADRDRALAAYRAHLPGPDTRGIDIDDVLGSLLHVHFVRAVAVDFPEEAACLYLARAAALAWTARTASRPA